MGQISGQPPQLRVPEKTSDNIDVNVCVNPTCQNFNTSPSQSRKDPHYKLIGKAKNSSSIQCASCGRYYIVKSNLAVSEEVERLRQKRVLATVYRQDGFGCHNLDCVQFGIYAETPSALYRRRGVTPAGNPRFQCKACGQTFTRGSSKRKSHPNSKNYENDVLFRLLVNQNGINRAVELADLDPKTIYHKIDMFYERCVYFLKDRESRLKQLPLGKLMLSSDRQEYAVNWTNRTDKRNVVLSAIGTADKRSSYVFGMEVNFDPDVNLREIVLSTEHQNEQNLKEYLRTHARIWMPRDLGEAVSANKSLKKHEKELTVEYFELGGVPVHEARVAQIIEELEQELGVSPVSFSDATTLPTNGGLVRSEYTMYAHFRMLRELIGHAERINFYLDQDQGINRAVLTAFADEVIEGRCRAGYVRINKNLTVDERRFRVSLTEKRIREMQANNASLNRFDAERSLVQDAITNPVTFDKSREVWYSHPIQRIYECDKLIAVLTDTEKMHHKSLINFVHQATLHPIDNFFQMVRRRLSFLERPISSQSNNDRVWTGRSPYNPAMVNKLLQILRVYYNFCLKGKDGKTPAQRLGLAKGPVEIRKILYP